VLFTFFRRVTRAENAAVWCSLTLGLCFTTWYFGTDIENVALALCASSLLLGAGWRRHPKDSITAGVLLGALGAFAVLCHQSLIVLAIFTGVYCMRQGMRRSVLTYFLSLAVLLGLAYLLVPRLFYSINTISVTISYVLGYVGQSRLGGWSQLGLSTPLAALVGFSRAFLGLHPLMNLDWVKELAVGGLPANVLSNQIAIAAGIPTTLQPLLIALTLILLLSLPVIILFAIKGSKSLVDDNSQGVDSRLMLLYAAVVMLLTIWWLPLGGEFWLPVVVVLLPLAARYLSGLKPALWIYAYVWTGLLTFTNLFGSILPFADETVDPTLPSILYLDGIRQTDDIYLIPYNQAYPQRWVFGWVIPIKAIMPDGSESVSLDKKIRDNTGRIYFSSDLFTLAEMETMTTRDTTYILNSSDWQRLIQNAESVHTVGSLWIMAAGR
jgi:hypothetical protein